MPRKATLSREEKIIVDAMALRLNWYLKLAEDHAAVVRALGPETLLKAHDEAAKALAPKTGKEVMYPPRGTNMEQYYQQFDAALNAKATTPFEHMCIAMIATGLSTVMMNCEYAFLSEAGQEEVDRRTYAFMVEEYNTVKGPATTEQLDRPRIFDKQELPVLPPIESSTKLMKLCATEISGFLQDFSKLHHTVLWDEHSDECFKVIGANFSPTRAGIESYEVQFEGCPSAVTVPYNDVKEMLGRSSHVRN